MKNLIYAIILLAMCSLARADVFTLTINSAPYNDGQHSVGFYNSTLRINDNVSIPLLTVCIDFTHTVGFGQAFEVTQVNLASYSGPMLINYLEAAYLVLQLQGVTDIGTISDIQRAIWLVTTPGTDNPYITTLPAFTYANQAALNYQNIDASQFNLLLTNGHGGQSAITMIPEPSTWFICILIGASMVWFMYLGRKQRAKK